MFTRPLAPPLLSLVVAVLLGSLLGAPLGTGCTWEPVARSVQPVRLIEGSARVLGLLDGPEGRWALVTIGTGPDVRRRIVNVAERTNCELPAGAREVGLPLRAPNQRGDKKVQFLQPLVQGEGVEGRLPDLWYTDEKCTLRGPFGSVARDPTTLALRADSRVITLVQGDNMDLRIVDPWTNAVRPIASAVADYRPVAQADNSTAPQALWLREGGKLTQRALDGTLLLTLGKDVDDFQQSLSDQLRVAYHDGEDIFEAKGPDFTPVLIAEDACGPEYVARSLELHKPCATGQLVRIDLTTAEVKTFAKGVTKSYAQGEISFEIQQPEDGGSTQVWAAFMGVRIQLLPTPVNAISALDREHTAGRTQDGKLGIWSTTQPFAVGYEGVQQVQTFRDARTGQLLWLVLYEVVANIGKLVLIEQEDLMRITAGLPPGVPTTLSENARANAYRVINTPALPEVVVFSLESPITMPDERTVAGTLYARFLSGSLGSKIDDGVASSEIVIAPVPGILYGIVEGPRSGLWFAAL